jgi:hypothetical protein
MGTSQETITQNYFQKTPESFKIHTFSFSICLYKRKSPERRLTMQATSYILNAANKFYATEAIMNRD